jgi:MerR family mercuric resistance operon transcriptional regulator
VNGFTIGQLAKAAGVPTSTVRFYERRGLLAPDARSESNYRAYNAESVERLRFIRAAQATGFSLKDIRGMLDLTYSEGPPCKEVAELITNRLVDVRERMKELRRVEKALSSALTSCCNGGKDWCGEIERLKGKTSPPQKSARRSLTLH